MESKKERERSRNSIFENKVYFFIRFLIILDTLWVLEINPNKILDPLLLG